MPRTVKKRRRLEGDKDEKSVWEEYFDYIFPDDVTEKPNMTLLKMAHEWKMKMKNV